MLWAQSFAGIMFREVREEASSMILKSRFTTCAYRHQHVICNHSQPRYVVSYWLVRSLPHVLSLSVLCCQRFQFASDTIRQYPPSTGSSHHRLDERVSHYLFDGLAGGAAVRFCMRDTEAPGAIGRRTGGGDGDHPLPHRHQVST